MEDVSISFRALDPQAELKSSIVEACGSRSLEPLINGAFINSGVELLQETDFEFLLVGKIRIKCLSRVYFVLWVSCLGHESDTPAVHYSGM